MWRTLLNLFLAMMIVLGSGLAGGQTAEAADFTHENCGFKVFNHPNQAEGRSGGCDKVQVRKYAFTATGASTYYQSAMKAGTVKVSVPAIHTPQHQSSGRAEIRLYQSGNPYYSWTSTSRWFYVR